ncbi:hypothetical protein GCK32_005020, partial [Trichostrongylus colubriformis]
FRLCSTVRSTTLAEEVPEIVDDVETVEHELDCLPEDIRKKFLEQIEAVSCEYEIEFLLNEIRTPKKFQYSLTDEMEEILKMEVGQYVSFLNFVEPELNQLNSPEFLCNAMVYTGAAFASANNCVSMSEKNVVQLYKEGDLSRYTKELNKVLRFAQFIAGKAGNDEQTRLHPFKRCGGTGHDTVAAGEMSTNRGRRCPLEPPLTTEPQIYKVSVQ